MVTKPHREGDQMSRASMVQECDQELQALLPELPRPEQKAVAGLIVGVVSEQSAVLSRAAAGMPGAAQDRSKQRRAQRLVANPRLDVPRTQRRVLARILTQRHGRLDLLLDATTTRQTTTVCFALAWHRRALPLLWRTWTRDTPGQDWTAAIATMADDLAAALPPTVQVVLLADRGLTGSPLARLAQAHGWHYLLRAQRQTQIRLADGTVCPLAALVPHPGVRQCLSAVRIYAPRRKRHRSQRHTGAGSWERVWSTALVTNVVAVWRRPEEEAWLVVTDLPARLERCSEYRRRTWQEELFRDLKSFGWNWQQSRVVRPERVERLLLILTLATVWILCLAQRLLKRGHRPLIEDRSRRCYSHFQLGLRFLNRLLTNDQPVPVLFHLWREATPCLKLS